MVCPWGPSLLYLKIENDCIFRFSFYFEFQNYSLKFKIKSLISSTLQMTLFPTTNIERFRCIRSACILQSVHSGTERYPTKFRCISAQAYGLHFVVNDCMIHTVHPSELDRSYVWCGYCGTAACYFECAGQQIRALLYDKIGRSQTVRMSLMVLCCLIHNWHDTLRSVRNAKFVYVIVFFFIRKCICN